MVMNFSYGNILHPLLELEKKNSIKELEKKNLIEELK